MDMSHGLVLGCRFKANCPLVGPGPIGAVPSMGGLSKGSCIYASFREKHGKLQTSRSTSATRVRTWHFPSTSFERYYSATGGAMSNGENKNNFYCRRVSN